MLGRDDIKMYDLHTVYHDDIKAKDIEYIKLTRTQKNVHDIIVKITKFFFKGGSNIYKIPFRGFLLEGPPGNGKTEIAKQAARTLSLEIGNVYIRFLDTARIASPQWGKAEEKLKNLFTISDKDGKYILLFDDIESLVINRVSSISREWHYSINSLIFHFLDILDPSNAIVIATTNMPELIDKALRSRLYCIHIPELPKNELLEIAKNLVENLTYISDIISYGDNIILNEVIEELNNLEAPSIRDIQHIIIKKAMDLVVRL